MDLTRIGLIISATLLIGASLGCTAHPKIEVDPDYGYELVDGWVLPDDQPSRDIFLAWPSHLRRKDPAIEEWDIELSSTGRHAIIYVLYVDPDRTNHTDGMTTAVTRMIRRRGGWYLLDHNEWEGMCWPALFPDGGVINFAHWYNLSRWTYVSPRGERTSGMMFAPALDYDVRPDGTCWIQTGIANYVFDPSRSMRVPWLHEVLESPELDDHWDEPVGLFSGRFSRQDDYSLLQHLKVLRPRYRMLRASAVEDPGVAFVSTYIDEAIDLLSMEDTSSWKGEDTIELPGAAQAASAFIDHYQKANNPERYAEILEYRKDELERKVRRLKKEGALDDALSVLDELIELDPSDAGGFADRAIWHRDTGDPARALPDIDRAIQLDPDYGWLYYIRGTICRALGDGMDATSSFDRSIAIDPEHGPSYLERAELKRARGNVAGADADEKRGRELQKKMAPMALQLATMQAAFRDHEEAESWFARALECDPEFTKAYLVRARYRKDRGNLGGALEDLNRALEIDPDYWMARAARGLLRMSTKEYDEAIEDFVQIEKMHPDAFEDYDQISIAYFLRACARTIENDFDGVIDDLLRIEQRDPEFLNNPRIREKLTIEALYAVRGATRYKNGDFEGATADVNKALHRDPENAFALQLRGVIKEDMGDSEGAISDYTASIELDPSDARIFRRRGSLYLERGELTKSLEDFNRAIELQPDDSRGYECRGAVRLALGDAEEAAADVEKLIELFPDSYEGYERLGSVKFMSGDFSGAAKALQKALELDPEASEVASASLYYVASRRSGIEAGTVNARLSKYVEDYGIEGDWHTVAAEMFLGNASPDDVLSAAEGPEDDQDDSDRARAHFQIAQWYLIEGDEELSRGSLQKVVELADDNRILKRFALVELQRLEDK